jgi:Pyruvate/2-oxoacid:ferredoxin oxidoreductase gamma subunit
MVMLGFLSAFLDLKPGAWTDTIRRRLPPEFMESSLEAFIKGADEAKTMMPAKGIRE